MEDECSRRYSYESELFTNGSVIADDSSTTVLEGCAVGAGAKFPNTQPAMIKNPPKIPVGVKTSPRVTKANAAPHNDVVVIRSVSSVADTTLRATVSKYCNEMEMGTIKG